MSAGPDAGRRNAHRRKPVATRGLAGAGMLRE